MHSSWRTTRRDCRRDVHEPLLKSIEKITGKRAEFIQWNGARAAA